MVLEAFRLVQDLFARRSCKQIRRGCRGGRLQLYSAVRPPLLLRREHRAACTRKQHEPWLRGRLLTMLDHPNLSAGTSGGMALSNARPRSQRYRFPRYVHAQFSLAHTQPPAGAGRLPRSRVHRQACTLGNHQYVVPCRAPVGYVRFVAGLTAISDNPRQAYDVRSMICRQSYPAPLCTQMRSIVRTI